MYVFLGGGKWGGGGGCACMSAYVAAKLGGIASSSSVRYCIFILPLLVV